ncbi:MAG: tRNA (N(6)-L-threonylcarbamoyladenosine(37)-C(2))-methylthiotransferase MtaB [Eubacteriales bacterium]
MRISFVTLGCKVNQYETQAMEKLLHARGHHTAGPGQSADAVIINTCAVTGESARKSRQAIRRAKKVNPEALIVVCGCFSQADADTARELGADFVGGAGERLRVVDFIDGAANQITHKTDTEIVDPFSRRDFEILPAGEVEGRVRALLKVQDGCVNFCSYCIIPYLRGPSRSLPVHEAVSSVIQLAEQGFKEIVITGIEISSYGSDIGTNLHRLIEELCKAAPSVRFRLGSLEPSTVREEFVESLSSLQNLCPHFHLSLQSGSAGVLRRMRRKYLPEDYEKSVSLLRSAFDDPAITTDLIVGFPGETEEEFLETIDFIKSIGFSAIHVFPYSIREGTRAALMDDQLPKSVKDERAATVAAVAMDMRRGYLNRQLGRTRKVLFETEVDGKWEGHSENYLPVLVDATNLRGQLAEVLITGSDGNRLTGKLLG